MVVFPNAKVNIGLNIINRRVDGYHNVETVMYPVGWCDILEIVPLDKGMDTHLSLSGRGVDCPMEENLVMKAYHAICGLRDIPPVEIHLHKVIPEGAGLGGGSSDAAFTLMALNQLFQLDLDETALTEMATTIGADCPFFIYNRPMFATGIGADLQPIDLNLDGYGIVIVKPPISVPTAWAYSMIEPQSPPQHLPVLLKSPLKTWQESISNDFEKEVFCSYRMIAEIKDSMMEAGAEYVSMSGAGSAVYGIFQNDKLSDSIKNSFSQYDIFIDEKLSTYHFGNIFDIKG